jgi:DNA-binding MarR family transcriptional regulator
MKQAPELEHFFEAIKRDPRISISHIVLYAAFYNLWRKQDGRSPVEVFRREMLDLTKISSSATYSKRINELSEYGYLRYEPSFNNKRPSRIFLLPQQ